ncbi:12S rRNA N(4)-cytidine methyltransferase METTL15-like [Styela clava]
MLIRGCSIHKLVHNIKSCTFIQNAFCAVIENGKSYATLHQPVMVKEVLNALYPQNGDIILDMTFGAGGHTKAILENCPDCKIIALDRDPYANSLAQQLREETSERVIPVLGRFSELEKIFQHLKIEEINGAILDAGCSSMQFDTGRRGFAISKDGPLDMRMDGDRYPDMPSAADVVNRMSAKDLAEILYKYGDERYAHKIARKIIQYRSEVGPIGRTRELANIVKSAFDEWPKSGLRKDALNRTAHSATKTFMAIRIFVNNELNELHEGLKTVERYMKKGGRLTAITFHSLEDVIVKRVISGRDLHKPRGMSLSQQRRIESASEIKPERKWMTLNKKIVIPQFDEVDDNARSRSAKLRSATRIT